MVVKGEFKFLKGHSPIRLNSKVYQIIKDGAESVNKIILSAVELEIFKQQNVFIDDDSSVESESKSEDKLFPPKKLEVKNEKYEYRKEMSDIRPDVMGDRRIKCHVEQLNKQDKPRLQDLAMLAKQSTSQNQVQLSEEVDLATNIQCPVNVSHQQTGAITTCLGSSWLIVCSQENHDRVDSIIERNTRTCSGSLLQQTDRSDSEKIEEKNENEISKLELNKNLVTGTEGANNQDDQAVGKDGEDFIKNERTELSTGSTYIGESVLEPGNEEAYNDKDKQEAGNEVIENGERGPGTDESMEIDKLKPVEATGAGETNTQGQTGAGTEPMSDKGDASGTQEMHLDVPQKQLKKYNNYNLNELKIISE